MSVQRCDLVRPSDISRLPPELWLAIFEQLLTCDVHVFKQSRRYRYDLTRELQRMQLVCRTWRHLIRPLTYRYVMFDYYEVSFTNSITYFAKLLDSNETLDPIKVSWIQTLWLCGPTFDDPRMSNFKDMFTSFLSQLPALREICIRKVFLPQQFEIVMRCYAPVLKKMAVAFKSGDLPKTMPLMSHFTALQDWHLFVSQIGSSPILFGKTDLPSLRLLELDAQSSSNTVLDYLSRSTISKLTEFRIRSYEGQSFDSLSTFMERYGSNLTVIEVESEDASITTAVFPYTPHLQTLEFETRAEEILELLQGLPISVAEVALSRFGSHVGYQGSVLKALIGAVEQLPHGSALRIIRAVSAHPLENPSFTWTRHVQREDKRRIELWKRFTQSAARLLALGVVVLDEEGVHLTDFLDDVDPSWSGCDASVPSSSEPESESE